MRKSTRTVLFSILLPFSSLAQAQQAPPPPAPPTTASTTSLEAQPNRFKVGDAVEADYDANNRWRRGVVTSVEYDGTQYHIKGAWSDSDPFVYPFHYKRVRSVSAASQTPKNTTAPELRGPPAHGKYGCAESIPRLRNGSFEYDIETRGYIHLNPNGQYSDPFGAKGRYRFDASTSATTFTGGALDKATATRMKDNRLWVVIPTASGERRWSCSRI